MQENEKKGFFQGKNRNWLFVAILAAFGAIIMPSGAGVTGYLVFPATIAGICFGMALMLLINLMNARAPQSVE